MFNVSFGDRKILMNLVKKRIPSPNKTVVPRELQSEENVDRLLNVYMSHPMWNDKKNIRDMFKALLSNGDYLTRILTTSDNFLDDTANVKRCFLSNLISTLQMMGEDVTLFESGSFEGINDLRDFVRLLSMNHTELIGHVVKEDLDIRVRNDVKGKNVGEELHVGDTIRINTNGKIDKVNNQLVIFDEGVDIIVHDRYTHDTKVVSFNSAYHGKNFPIPDENEEILASPFTNPVKIENYEEWWGWNLLLPDSFKTVNNKIINLTKKLNNAAISRNTSENIKNEIVRLKKVKAEIISGYYSFHILIPTRNDVRKGNFMDDKFVTSRIESTDDWEAQWGISHEVLMKILIEHGFLKNNRGHDFDNREDTSVVIDVTKYFEKNEIATSIKVDGEEQTYDLSGSVRIVGEILDKTGNLLTISLDKGTIANRDTFHMVKSTFECFVDDEGNIEETNEVFSLVGNRAHGKLNLKLGGTIKNPNFVLSAELEYTPAVTKRVVDEIITLKSHVYVDDVIQDNTDFIGKLRIFGEIVGIGDNTLIVEFLGGTVLYNGSPKLDSNGNPYDNIILEYDDNVLMEG